MLLEIDANGWVAIIVALGGFVTILGTATVGVIIAWRTGQKVEANAARNEQLAQAIIDPKVTELPPKPPAP